MNKDELVQGGQYLVQGGQYIICANRNTNEVHKVEVLEVTKTSVLILWESGSKVRYAKDSVMGGWRILEVLPLKE
jgi:hypothetical protein